MAIGGQDCVIKTDFGEHMGGMVMRLRLVMGRKKESNGRRPGRLAKMFLG